MSKLLKLTAELVVGDIIYNSVKIEPALWFITELDKTWFSDLLAAMEARYGKLYLSALARESGQEVALVKAMVSGKTVSNTTASAVLTLIKKYLPQFPGEIEDDLHARKIMNRRNRESDNAGLRADVKGIEYTKKVSACLHEVAPH